MQCMCTRELLSSGSLSCVSSASAVTPLQPVVSQDENKSQSRGSGMGGLDVGRLGALGSAALDPFRVLPG